MSLVTNESKNVLTYEEYCSDKKKVGEYFGYPPCCIAQFVELQNGILEQNMLENSNVRDVFEILEKYSICYQVEQGGFIPCFNHAEQILSKKVQLSDLIRNRKCKTPFPQDNDDLLVNYDEQLTKETYMDDYI